MGTVKTSSSWSTWVSRKCVRERAVESRGERSPRPDEGGQGTGGGADAVHARGQFLARGLAAGRNK
jgi:hypothetical protein